MPPGFSLVELLLVVLIIGVLVGILLPAIGKSRRAARAVACTARLRAIQLCTRVYADEYRRLPVVNPEKSVLEFELPVQTWRCPEDREAAAVPLSEVGYSTYWYLGVYYMDPPPAGIILSLLKPGVGLRRYEANPSLPLFWDRNDVHARKRNVVYWNGAAGAWED